MSHKYFLQCETCRDKADDINAGCSEWINHGDKNIKAVVSVYPSILEISRKLFRVPGFYGDVQFDMPDMNNILEYCREHEGHELWLGSEYDGLVEQLTKSEV